MVCFGPGAVILDIQTSVTTHETSFPGSYQSETTETSREKSGKATTCAVCWNKPAGEVYTTTCGHTYCASCFANQCFSVDANTIPIRCLGADGHCQHIFEMPELKTALDDEAFKNLLRRALTAHVATRPDTFRYCPGPDCPNIYRVSKEGEVISCSKCQLLLCATCHTEHHDGRTCDENKDRTEGNMKAFSEWKATNKAKECPSCGIPIQKIAGCNHIRCVSCKAHLCWVCLKVCKSSRDTYAHMEAEHGSYVDPDEDALRELDQLPVPEMGELGQHPVLEMPPLPPGLRGPQRIEQLQDYGGLVDLDEAYEEFDLGEMGEPNFQAPYREQDMLRIRFAWALRPFTPARFLQLPARGRERLVGEHGPYLAPLQVAELVDMLRQRRDISIFRHLEQLSPRDVDIQLRNLAEAIKQMDRRAREADAHDLLDLYPDMVDQHTYMVNENADYARIDGGRLLVNRLYRRLEGRIPDTPMTAPNLTEVLLLLKHGEEVIILHYAEQLAQLAPLELENLFQAVDEAIDIVAREEEAEAMDEPAGIPRAPALAHRIDPEDAAGNQLIQRIARRVRWRMQIPHLRLWSSAAQLQVLRQDRMGLINRDPEFMDEEGGNAEAVMRFGVQFMTPLNEVPTAADNRLFKHIQRRIRRRHGEQVLPQTVEILVLFRQNREDLVVDFYNYFQELDPEIYDMEPILEEAFEIRRREILGDLVVRREADARIAELAAQLG